MTPANCPTLMAIICCHCKREYSRKDGRGVEGPSHGSCPECHEKIMEQLGVSTIERTAIYEEVCP